MKEKEKQIKECPKEVMNITGKDKKKISTQLTGRRKELFLAYAYEMDAGGNYLPTKINEYKEIVKKELKVKKIYNFDMDTWLVNTPSDRTKADVYFVKGKVKRERERVIRATIELNKSITKIVNTNKSFFKGYISIAKKKERYGIKLGLIKEPFKQEQASKEETVKTEIKKISIHLEKERERKDKSKSKTKKEGIEPYSKTSLKIDWNKYLSSVSKEFSEWWDCYTPTDAVAKKERLWDLSAPMVQLELLTQTLRDVGKEDFSEKDKIERLMVLEGLAKYASEHVLLMGHPGSGKSTALARLLLEKAMEASKSPKAKIPVLIELKKYYSGSVIDLIINFMKDYGINLDGNEVNKLLSDGRLLLLFDGVNELPSEVTRNEISNFRKEYWSTTPMVFTTRALGIGGDLGIDIKLEILPLARPQIEQFVHANLKKHVGQLLKQLTDPLAKLAQTPLFLKMLCAIFKNDKKIPSNMGLVFRRFAKGYVENIKRDVQINEEYREFWPEALKRIANNMMYGEEPKEMRLTIQRSEAEKIIAQLLMEEEFRNPRRNARKFLDDLLNHHLIQTTEINKVEFHHQLIQEYYAAEYLLKLLPNLSDDFLRREYLNYLKWTESLALMLELVEDLDQAKRVIELALNVDVMLAARLAGSVKKDFQKQCIDLLMQLDVLLEFKIRLLEETQSEEATFVLREFVSDKISYFKISAIGALSKIRSESTASVLIQALNDKDPDVRARAAWALGQIGSDAAVEPLIQALNDKHLNVRARAAWALGQIGDEAAVEPLIQALKNETSHIHASAAEALGEIGSDAAVDVLIQALNSKDSRVKESAAEALGQIGSGVAADALIQALNDKDVYVRASAAEALREIGSDAAVDTLIQALNDEIREVHQLCAASALGQIGGDVAVDALIRALNSEDSRVKESAAWELGQIGGDVAVDALIRALNDKDVYVRAYAAEALGKIGSDAAVEPLIQALNDEIREVHQLCAASALGQIGGDAAVDALIRALNSEDSGVRASAASALGKIGGEAAVEPLIKTLNDEDRDVRWRVFDALGKIGGDAAVEPLIQALNDKDPDVLVRAAWALEKIGNPELLPCLKEILFKSQYITIIIPIIFSIQKRSGYYDPRFLN